MGSKASRQLQDEEIKAIQEETGFTPNQIIRLFTRFTSLDKSGNGTLSRDSFIRIPELAVNPLADRIVDLFFNKDATQMTDGINFRQFARTLAHFRPCNAKTEENAINSKIEKLRLLFSIYDMDNDGEITKENLIAILGLMVGANITNEQLNFIAERTLLESDKDEDRSINFQEFLDVMKPTESNNKMSVRFLD